MDPVEAARVREIRQAVAAMATFLPAEHAAYIRALPQDRPDTLVEAYLALRHSGAHAPANLLDRVHVALSGEGAA